MPRRAASHPTDGELEILHVLWDRGPLALSEICAALRERREVATTTVATMLRVMADKRLVRRKQAGRSPVWTAAVTRDAAAGGMVSTLLDRVFDGSASRLVAHLVEDDKLSEQEIAELRRLLKEKGGVATKGKRGKSK